MSRRARHGVFLVSGAGLVLLLLWGLCGLPGFGAARDSYGIRLNAVTVRERHLTNVVTAVNFDYRGFDTLGEEYILFAAVAGVALLLRELRAPREESPRHRLLHRRSEAVRWLSIALIALTDLFGIYVVIHAHLTPGGGFQGGVILGTGSLLAYLATDYRIYRRVTPKALMDLVEAVGAGGYALIGLATLMAGGAFLENVLPLGQAGDLLASGTIPLINFSVGLEVAGGFALLFQEFLEETEPMQPDDGEPEESPS